jgi:hypothetical protein
MRSASADPHRGAYREYALSWSTEEETWVSTTEVICECPEHKGDPYSCWEAQHDWPTPSPMYRIEQEGGPCRCGCHAGWQLDDEEYEAYQEANRETKS